MSPGPSTGLLGMPTTLEGDVHAAQQERVQWDDGRLLRQWIAAADDDATWQCSSSATRRWSDGAKGRHLGEGDDADWAAQGHLHRSVAGHAATIRDASRLPFWLHRTAMRMWSVCGGRRSVGACTSARRPSARRGLSAEPGLAAGAGACASGALRAVALPRPVRQLHPAREDRRAEGDARHPGLVRIPALPLPAAALVRGRGPGKAMNAPIYRGDQPGLPLAFGWRPDMP